MRSTVRQDFALLLAEPSAAGLTFAGKVGTGFSFREADELHALLRSTVSSEPVVIVPHEVRREKPTWVEPKLMARVGHSGRGSNGFLRHSVYRGTGIALFCPGSALGPAGRAGPDRSPSCGA